MKTLEIKWGNAHILKCPICYEMTRRGYVSENKYWDDFFKNKLKSVKYKLVKSWGKNK